jgi:hypothetical protein
MQGLELVVMLPVDCNDHAHYLHLLWLLILALAFVLIPLVVLLLWLISVLWMRREL